MNPNSIVILKRPDAERKSKQNTEALSKVNTKSRTLEEREADYAAARLRILGNQDAECKDTQSELRDSAVANSSQVFDRPRLIENEVDNSVRSHNQHMPVDTILNNNSEKKSELPHHKLKNKKTPPFKNINQQVNSLIHPFSNNVGTNNIFLNMGVNHQVPRHQKDASIHQDLRYKPSVNCLLYPPRCYLQQERPLTPARSQFDSGLPYRAYFPPNTQVMDSANLNMNVYSPR